MHVPYLQRGKVLEAYRYLGGYHIISLDGTGQFSSEKVHCESCCEKHHRNGHIGAAGICNAEVLGCAGGTDILTAEAKKPIGTDFADDLGSSRVGAADDIDLALGVDGK